MRVGALVPLANKLWVIHMEHQIHMVHLTNYMKLPLI